MLAKLLTLLVVSCLMWPPGVCACRLADCPWEASGHGDGDGDDHDPGHVPGCPVCRSVDRQPSGETASPLPAAHEPVGTCDCAPSANPSECPTVSVPSELPLHIVLRTLRI
jgi:hypothetical protein